MNRKAKRKRRKVGNCHISLQAIKQYLLFGTYPPGCSQIDKRSVRKRAEGFKICDDELYYIAKPKHLDDEQPDPNPEADINNHRKAVLTTREQLAVTNRVHVSDTGVHKGMERTLHGLTSKYYWVGMSTTVRQVIKSCAICLVNRPNSSFQSSLQKHIDVSVCVVPSLPFIQAPDESDETKAVQEGKENPVEGDCENAIDQNEMSYTVTSELQNPEEEDPDLNFDATNVFGDDGLMAQSDINAQRFWERVEIQIICPTDENKKKKHDDLRRKSKYVIVALDSFSKWPEVKKLDKVNEQTVSQFVIQLIARFGMMNQLVLLENNVMVDQSLVLSGIMQNLSTFDMIVLSESLNPFDQHWSNLCLNICHFVERYPESWSSCLDLCLMPLRNSVSPQMDYSPAYVAMKREPIFPSFLLPPKESATSEVMLSQEQIESSIENLMTKYQECCEADVKQVIAPLESIPVHVKQSSVKEELIGVRRSGRKVTVSHRLADFEEVVCPASAYARDNSLENDSIHEIDNDEEEMIQSVPPKKRKHDPTVYYDIAEAPSSEDALFISSQSSRNLNVTTKNDSVRVTVSRKRSNGEEDLDKMDISTFYTIIKQYIENGSYPLNSPVTFKRIVRKAREMYCIEDKKLMYVHKNKKKVLPMTFKERLEILNDIHTSTEDHVPKSRMLDEMERRGITWRAVGLDVDAYIKACPSCKHGITRTRMKWGGGKKWQKDSDSEDDGSSVNEKFANGIRSYPDLIDYLTTGTLPSYMARAERVVFKKKAKTFKLVKDVLYYCPLKARTKPRKVLLTKEERLDAMKQVHGDSHFAPQQMISELRKSYYWRPMTSDVEEFVGNCCQTEVDMIKEKKDDELKLRIELFKKHFQGEDISGQTVDVDSIFPSIGDDDSVTTREDVPDEVSEALDDQTGLLLKSGQEDVDEDIATAVTDDITVRIEMNANACDGLNDGSEKDNISIPEGADSDGMVVSVQRGGEKDLKEISGKENPFGHVRKRGLKTRCNICHVIIRGENKYKEHMYKHTGVKPFLCQVCNKKFTTVKGMRLHMRKHTGHRPYLCNICGRGFPRSASLHYHIKTHDKNVVPVVCEICNRIFTSEQRLKKHKRFKHPSKSPIFKCETCGKHFTAKRSLKRHEEAHQGIRRYICTFCKRSFFRKEYLTYHLDSHYKDNPAMSHLTSKRKFRRRANQKQEKDENTNILSILRVEPEMGQEEVYTQLVEVTHPQRWTEGATQVNEGHSLPTVFSLDGTLQVSEVVDQVNTGTPIAITEESATSTSEHPMEIHHIIMPSSQLHLNQPLSSQSQLHLNQPSLQSQLHLNQPSLQSDDHHEQNQHHQQTVLHHDQQIGMTTQNNGHIQVTLSNGQKLTLARTEGIPGRDLNQDTIQYHVECLSGETLSEADLNAITMLAQSSVLQQ